MKFEIDKTAAIFTEYFHALAVTEPTNIFDTTTTSFHLTLNPDFQPYDVVHEVISKFIADPVPILRTDGTKVMVPLVGNLYMPPATFTGKVPLVMIGHGNHKSLVTIAAVDDLPNKPKLTFTVLPETDRILSYDGYSKLQETLATQGIASYSIDLNIVNVLRNNAPNGFESQALDFNQRILLFFHHLKLLKTLAVEPVAEPTGPDALPLRFFNGTSFVNLKDELAGFPSNPTLVTLQAALANRIDFTKLGFMGHSRGADAVSRIPAYFHKTTPFIDPDFPKHIEVNKRIKNLCVQVGSPLQDHIKSILALQPTAVVNLSEPAEHGYIIDNQQTMFFVGLGTHDEDVSLDPVRIYEYPTCPKAMIVLNGASHKGFNTLWAKDSDEEPLIRKTVKVRLLKYDKQAEILSAVFAPCFTATLTSKASDLKYFTGEGIYPVTLNGLIDIQRAWKFGFPFGSPNVMNGLDAKVTGITKSSVRSTGFKFEQDINAFTETRQNEGIFTIPIPLDFTSDSENLSKHTHFSFRYARGYNLKGNCDRIEYKNFSIEFFQGNTRIGKTIEGKNISSITLRALRAFDEIERPDETKQFEYSILLQTVEILLPVGPVLKDVNRIEVKVIPDITKWTTTQAKRGSIAAGVLGGGVGVGGSLIATDGEVDGNKKWLVVAAGAAGAGLGSLITYKILQADENAFAFTDFLLTNRHI